MIYEIASSALRDSSYGIALGADSPGIPMRYLEEARTSLLCADAVIGPCDDGGFYLLGLRRCPKGLLTDIAWSQSTTFTETLAKLQGAGLRVSILKPWFDVDRPRDLMKLRRLIVSGKIRAEETRKILEGFRLNDPVGDLLVSIIIPTLNERECLPQALAKLQGQEWIHEVIVSDGGSTDGTREWLSEQNFPCVVHAPCAKGVQINAGAKAATGDILLLLHADCLLPSDAYQQIQRAMRIEEAVGGCFRVCFAETQPRSLGLVAAGINLRSRLTRSGTGDQAVFVRRRVFEDVGGCPDWPLFEDVDLVRRMKRLGQFVVTQSAVTVSPRRYISLGVFTTVFLIYALRIGYWIGLSPITLKKWFDDVRPHLRPRASRLPIGTKEKGPSCATNLRIRRQ